MPLPYRDEPQNGANERAAMMSFTQSPHQPRLYVADPSEDEAGWIG